MRTADQGTDAGPGLHGGVLVCDGAMGTMLHSAGVPLDRSLSELNLTAPQLVRDLHAAYAAAGAAIIQTNTFDASRLRLARFGLEDSAVEINIAGARLARDAVRDSDPPVLVAGSVGPANSATIVPRIPPDTRVATLREQIAALADWVDLIMLETFGDIESLVQAAEIALAECDLPVIAQMTFGDDGRTLRGEKPAEVAAALAALEVAAVGANCTVGPAVLHSVVAELVAGCTLPVSVQPNAGIPVRLGRQLRYAHNVDYFADAAARFVAEGATIVGGCCGTTPAHIRAIARTVAPLTPARPAWAGPRRAAGQPARRAVTAPPPGPPPVSWPDAPGLTVIAGLQAPQGNDVQEFVEQARELKEAGARFLALTDPAPPMTRVNPVAAGVVLAERVGCDVILPVETADRSLSALQADLLGAHALGLRMIVCRTGTPRVIGDYPDPGSQWDVDSVRLITALSGLNDGRDWRGVVISRPTRFVIGGSLSTSAADTGHELARAEEKARAGAHFLLTDVIYDVVAAHRLLSALRGRGVLIPVIAAVAPYEDPTAAQRLAHEIPEMSAPAGQALAGRAAPGAAEAGWPVSPADAAGAVTGVVAGLAGLVSGIVIHAPHGPGALAGELIRQFAGGSGPT
jgi:methionine synthase / methylenetetrahydrofolate reductase(NADPH)